MFHLCHQFYRCVSKSERVLRWYVNKYNFAVIQCGYFYNGTWIAVSSSQFRNDALTGVDVLSPDKKSHAVFAL